MWTPTALASEVKSFGGTVWRVVEHQYTASTRKIVNTLADQDILETILEESKPLYPDEAEKLNYLLKTPFRYYPPNPYGSRFRRANTEQGVFYASEHIRSALAEFAYGRLLFFSLSINTPLPRNQERLTAFTVSYETINGVDLTRAPLNRDKKIWMNPNDYGSTQTLAETARNANIKVLRYQSTRDEENGGINIALLSPSAFTCLSPLQEQSWYLYIGAMEINCIRGLARISHHPSTADADPSGLTGRSLSNRLNVVSATPSPSSSLSTPSDRRLDALVTKGGEKCGLARKENERWTFVRKQLKFDSDHKIIPS